MKNRRNWIVSQLAFEQQKEIFRITASFPKEELFSLTSQLRRSSRSVYANLAEAYRKTAYTAHFKLKLTDADAENCETSAWLDVAVTCNYLTEERLQDVRKTNEEIGKLLSYMMRFPEKFRFQKEPEA